MRYDKLIVELREEALDSGYIDNRNHLLLLQAALAIEELQSTVVIVEVKDE